MFKSVVYQGNSLLGEVEIYPQNQNINMTNKEIRISHFSQPSDRCPPLAVLHTIASCGVCFKMGSKLQSLDSPLFPLHSSCFKENKTAVMPLGEEELHLVAMASGRSDDQYLCFWGYNVPKGLYNSCLSMLNLRCLGIIFDLDETLIVANTMRSFEDRIDALQRKINTEVDPQRISGMLAEIRRYQEDKLILKQYVENDHVIENGKVIKVQFETVPALSNNHQPIIRPLIRLREQNIILTRINPVIRDTSVLVRLRPAWEDLRSYLTARGRKRFEVYVCTMAERDYALEMWRLLDPDFNLISSKELLDRIVCIKSGSRKSLLNVFQDGICNPKMALVIDDRLKVWDEKDQPRVHVVPAFTPYYAPQAEANNVVPVLCVARNVACNVRGIFFKEFDEGLLQKIPEVLYEDDMRDFPSPDVRNYLISEDDAPASNGNKDPHCFDGMANAEFDRKLKDAVPVSSSMFHSMYPRVDTSLQSVMTSSLSTVSQPISQGSTTSFPANHFQPVASLVGPFGQVCPSEPALQGSPPREEGEVPESELDPNTRRRLLILRHGQDTRDHASIEHPFPVRPPLQIAVPVVSSIISSPDEEEISLRKLNQSILVKSLGPSDRTLHANQKLSKEAHHGDDRLRFNYSLSSCPPFSGEDITLSQSSSRKIDLHFESGQGPPSYPETFAMVLQEIAIKCGTKVEFRPALIDSTELQFSVEVFFIGEKIGEGIGRTRKEAQHQAAERSLMNLANKFLSHNKTDSISLHGDLKKLPHSSESGFLSDTNSFEHEQLPKEDAMLFSNTSEPSGFLDPSLVDAKNSMGSISALKELCTMEGLHLVFTQPPLTTKSICECNKCAQVEIGGQVLGTGTGSTWDEAKISAAEEALGNLKSMIGKRLYSPRSLEWTLSKRMNPDFQQVLQQRPSFAM